MNHKNYGFQFVFNIILLVLFWSFQTASGLGCIPQLCEENTGNFIANADCTKYRDHCGSYGGKRFDNSLLRGIDISCAAHKHVFAPFDGTLAAHKPKGGQKASACIDTGLTIQGSGKWSGYTALISYIKPIKSNGEVKLGDVLGISLDLTCASGLATGSQSPHVLFQLLFQDKPVDPTNRVSECMCTGQICSSNSINEFVGSPFKHKVNFGKGYELNCANTKENENSQEIVPEIYAPIEASFLGRFRPRNATENDTFTCNNDGVFLIGSGNWKDFVVHIYNVKFIVEPGTQHIEQGKPIAQRLTCPGMDINTIFVEFRHLGKLVNVTNLIAASDCKLPKFS